MKRAKPSDVSTLLRGLASSLDSTATPSRSKVASALSWVLASFDKKAYFEFVASDRTFSVTVRDRLVEEIQKLVPGEFSGQYDTNEAGKGFRPGYVSFGLKPATWENEGIIGGLLFRVSYDPSAFRSETTDVSGPDFSHSQGGAVLDLSVEVGYYNKKVDGSVETQGGTRQLSSVTVSVNEKEIVEEVEITDPSGFSNGIKSLIKEISSNPPDYAQSAKLKKKHVAPTGTPASLLKWLQQTGRSDVGQSELDALARAEGERTGKPFGQAMEVIKKFFQSRHWAINPNTLKGQSGGRILDGKLVSP